MYRVENSKLQTKALESTSSSARDGSGKAGKIGSPFYLGARGVICGMMHQGPRV